MPPTTRRSGGATGAGVPRPSMTKRAKACSRKATPAPIEAPPTMRTASGASSIFQSVSRYGTSPATTPGASRRKAALPAAAALRRDGCGLSGKARDQLGEPLGLVLRDEGVGVLDSLQPGAPDGVSELLREGDLEEAVLHRPGEQRRPVKVAELLGSLEREARVDAAQDLDGVAADLTVREEGLDPLPRGRAVEVALDQSAEGVGEAPHRAEPHALHRSGEQRRHPRRPLHRAEGGRQEVLEGVAV